MRVAESARIEADEDAFFGIERDVLRVEGCLMGMRIGGEQNGATRLHDA
jgi:hypothetical protein